MFKKRSDHSETVDTVRGRMLKRLKELLHMIVVNMNFIIYYMIGSSRIDGEIIYS